MNVLEAIKERRSIRYFTGPVPDEIIKKIIEAGTWAPSACNRQAWKFIIINNQKIKRKIIQEGTAFFVDKAPNLILIIYNNRTDNTEYYDHIQSASACIQNMQLAAHAYKYGSCCIANLPPKKRLRKILKIPNHYEPIALLALGKPNTTPKPLPRKENFIAYNQFNFKEEKTIIKKHILRKILRKTYKKLPKKIKTFLDPLARKFEKRFD